MTRSTRGRWTFGTLPGAVGRPVGEAPGGLVVKFGGSLLERGDWPDLARDLLATLDPMTRLTVVIGGGAIVEGLRAIDAAVPGDERVVHRLAIDGMGITARYVAAILDVPLVAAPLPADRAAPPPASCAVLDMAAWLESAPDRDASIDRSWRVTSDSLAAHVASAHGLGLLLAKSVPPSTAESLMALARSGWVDAAFPGAARAVEGISWCAPLD